MSELPTSAACLTLAIENDSFQSENFHRFFECWLVEQSEYLKDLKAKCEKYQARKAATPRAEDGPTPEPVDESFLRSIIKTVIQHYELYYRAKSTWAKHDAVRTFSPAWRSSLEDAFSWMGGWRPCVAIHLVYTKSGLQLEGNLAQSFRALTARDLGDLSPDQLVQVDELHKRIVRQERQITEMMAALQETLADSSMVELSHAVTEILRGADKYGEDISAEAEARVDETLTSKEYSLEEVLQTADDMRLGTLKEIVDILTPIQAVHFLIAAAELHLRLNEWGKSRGVRHELQNGSGDGHVE